MSDSVRPHRRQPTRLPHPWDSPGKNTGVGCHFLLQCMKVKSEREVAQLCPNPSDPMDCSLPGSSVHGIFQARVLEWGAIAFSDIKVIYLYIIHVKVKLKVTQPFSTLCNPMNYTVHGILQARIPGVGSLSLLQGIFPTQESNPGLLHCRQNLYQPSHKGSPRILEWVAYPFSGGSSQPRN